MLRRTVTVGIQYALHIWIGYLIILTAILIILFYSREWGSDEFRAASTVVVVYVMVGIITSVVCLCQIEEKAQQIREDLDRLVSLVHPR